MKAELLASIQAEGRILLDAHPGTRVVVWGAGEVGHWLMGELGPRGVAFVDSNPTKLGARIAGRRVHGLDGLEELEFDEVWVAVLSDSSGVGQQLEARGLRHRVVFPSGKRLQVQDQLPRTLAFLERFDLEGRDVLEVGCGGQLFLGLTLAHLGAARVHLCDVEVMGNPLEQRRTEWLDFLAHLESVRPRQACAETLLGRIELEPRPVDASELPFEGGSLDAVVNTGVMEHVTNPARAIQEFGRVLRPGGLALCLAIGIHDHRANDPRSEFTPWSFLSFEPDQWRALGGGAYHQNRWRAVDFARALDGAGFEVLAAEATRDPRLGADEVRTFAPSFREGYTLEELSELDLYLAGVRSG
jgi:SAM-dependent methyltransferase